ncbi:MAG: hypothetical protein Q7S75_02015 [bacterium]|nr:hypothetical protein [bacterium]
MDPSEHEKEKIERLRRAMYSRSLSEKIKDRPRRILVGDKTAPPEDWQKQEQEPQHDTVITPMSTKPTKGVLRWFLFAAIAFLVGIAGFFAYYFTIGGGALSIASGNIGISVSGPPNVPGGETTELQITVSNKNSSAIQLADLIVTYPPGTRSSTQVASDVLGKRISIGTLESGGVRNIPIQAVFSGSEGQHATIKVELEYRLAGSSAIFVTPSADYELTFSSSPISVAIDGNKETVSGQPIRLTLTISSNAQEPIRDVLLSVGYPFGFVFSSADLKQSRPGLWELGDIIPGKSIRIAINGTLIGESGDERIFRTTLGTRTTKNSQNIDTVLSENSYSVSVSKPFLNLAVSVNKESGSGVIVAPGDTVDVSIAWQNNLLTSIADAVIVASLSGIQIDGQTVHSNDGFYRSADSAVLWDKTTTGGTLSSLSPSAKGTVGFSFIMPTGDALGTLRNPILTITVHAAVKRLSESGVPENLQATASQIVKVASNLEITAEGHYYENPFGSVGPMPPKGGAETTYAIVLIVTNTTNKINGAKLTAHLPPYTRSLGMYIPSSEKISFNNTDGTLTWDVGDIESGVGVRGNAPRLVAVALGVTPSTSQIGEIPPILQNISLSGIDSATGASVTRTAPDVTTNILGDAGFSSTNATVVR